MKKLLLLGVVGVVSLLFIGSLPLQGNLIAEEKNPFIPKWQKGDEWRFEVKSWQHMPIGRNDVNPYFLQTCIQQVKVLGVEEKVDGYATYRDIDCWKLELAVVNKKGERLNKRRLVFYIRKESLTMLQVESWVAEERMTDFDYNYYGDTPFMPEPGSSSNHPTDCLSFPEFPKECKDEVRKFKIDPLWVRSKLPVITQEVRFPDDETMEIKITREDMVVWQKWKKGKPWWVEYWSELYENGKPVPYSRVEARLMEKQPTPTSESVVGVTDTVLFVFIISLAIVIVVIFFFLFRRHKI